MPPHLLTNFEIQKYYQNKSKFKSFYSRNNLYNIMDEAYVTDLDYYNSIGIHWTDLYVNGDNVTFFDSFVVEHIPKEIKKFIGNKNMITNICRIQAHNSIMCRYFSIGFINFMLKGKILIDHINIFSPNEYQKNDKIILQYV